MTDGFPKFIVGSSPEKNDLWVLHSEYPQGLVKFDDPLTPSNQGVELHFLCNPEDVTPDEAMAVISEAVEAARKWISNR